MSSFSVLHWTSVCQELEITLRVYCKDVFSEKDVTMIIFTRFQFNVFEGKIKRVTVACPQRDWQVLKEILKNAQCIHLV